MKATCSKCPAEWTGATMCHCSACHETFTGITLFDAHRIRGACADPAAVLCGPKTARAGESLMRRDSRGVWRTAEDRPSGSWGS